MLKLRAPYNILRFKNMYDDHQIYGYIGFNLDLFSLTLKLTFGYDFFLTRTYS